MIYCADVAGLTTASCCDSCHDDADDYGYDLFEIEPPNRHRQRRRTYAVVCCAHTSLVRAWGAKEWAAALRRKRAASK